MARQKKNGNANSKYVLTNYDVQVRSVNRNRKDIADWRDAHKAAESIHAPNRVRLYDLYDDVLLDGHLSGIIGKRFDAVLNKEIFFTRNKQRVEALDDLCGSLRFRDLIQLILETKLWGISGIEFIPGGTFEFLPLKRKHIKPDIHIYATEQNGREGFAYSKLPNLWVLGKEDDLGLLL